MIQPVLDDGICTVYLGDCIAVMAELADASVDAVVTDPPYGLEFMGKDWDAPWKSADGGVHAEARSRRADEMADENKRRFIASSVNRYEAGVPFQRWCEQWASECLRVLKPGGHLLAFGGARTWHRLAAAIEDAGFEIRDSITWLYGSGFPKSLDVSKALDKAEGHWRGKAGEQTSTNGSMENPNYERSEKGEPVTAAAAAAAGWGTALKPASEPIVVARKSLVGTVAQNWAQHGTGAINIDACRVPTDEPVPTFEREPGDRDRENWRMGTVKRTRAGEASAERRYTDEGGTNFAALPGPRGGDDRGRWPTNVVIDEEAAHALDEQTGTLTSGKLEAHHADNGKGPGTLGAFPGRSGRESYGDSGGASRFYPVFRYEAKADQGERPRVGNIAHPTVKPLDLMRWLVRLVTPPGGLVLDPFLGSGTTAEACLIENFRCIGIEREEDYMELIKARLGKAIQIGLAL